MNRLLRAVTLASVFVAAGCGRHDHDHSGRDHASHEHSPDEHSSGHDSGDGHFDGAEFIAERGLVLSDATRASIGLQTAPVTQRRVPKEIRFTVQIFREEHRPHLVADDHSGCDVHGSALLPMEFANQVAAGQRVELLQRTNQPPPGVVLGADRALALGELEVVVGFSNAAAALRPGDFLPARIRVERDAEVLAVPSSAILRTAEGTHVYVESGGAFRRTPVLAGSQSEGWTEIVRGLSGNEAVVTQPVQTLWLAELRATRGGGHSH